MKKLVLVVGALALSGCGTVSNIGGESTGAGPRTSGPDTCNAAAYAGLIGQDAVVALQIPDPKRSYRPDEAITLDNVPQRVNIVLDDTDVITAITCG